VSFGWSLRWYSSYVLAPVDKGGATSTPRNSCSFGRKIIIKTGICSLRLGKYKNTCFLEILDCCGGITRKSYDPCKKQGPKHTSCTIVFVLSLLSVRHWKSGRFSQGSLFGPSCRCWPPDRQNRTFGFFRFSSLQHLLVFRPRHIRDKRARLPCRNFVLVRSLGKSLCSTVVSLPSIKLLWILTSSPLPTILPSADVISPFGLGAR
jgi:hypothetical protein